MSNRKSLLVEILYMCKRKKSYWIAPLILLSLIFVVLTYFATAGGGGIMPFMYTIF